MRRIASIALCATALAALALPAEARVRHPRQRVVMVDTFAPPLTIQKRSFLDPGPVVPVRSLQQYVTVGTGPAQNPMEQGFGRSKFGNEALPRSFDPPIPGRPVNLFDVIWY